MGELAEASMTAISRGHNMKKIPRRGSSKGPSTNSAPVLGDACESGVK